MAGPDASRVLLLNKSGIPLDDKTFEEMFNYCLRNDAEHEQIIVALRSVYRYSTTDNLPMVKIPRIFVSTEATSKEKLENIQNYLNEFNYNYTGMQFFEVDRKATLEKQYGLAKLMIKAALPIKCLEATILGMYMTQGLKEFRRFTISFTSEFKEQPFKHVVLGVYASGRFGALGLSRRSDLMYKPLEFPTLYSLIQSYSLAYAKNFHQLVRVKIGLVIPHEPHIFETIPWKGLIISKSLLRRLEEMKRVLDQYSRVLRGQIDVLLIMEHSLRLPALSSQSNSTPEIISKQQSTRPKRNWSKGSRRRVTKLKRFAKPSCTVVQSSVFANGVGIPSDIIPKPSTKKSDPFYQIRI